MSHILTIFCSLCTCFFFHCSSFSSCWSQAFIISSLPLYDFYVLLPMKFLFFLFFISRYSSFSVIHVNVEKKEDSACFFSLKILVAMRFTATTCPRDNRPLPSSKNPHFHNEARCTTFLAKMSFVCMTMKNDFHIKGRAPTLVLKQRPGGTRKRPIDMGLYIGGGWTQGLTCVMW